MKVLNMLIVVVVATTGMIWGQEDTLKKPTYGWTHGMVGGVTLTQVAYTDWAQGGENSLAWTLTLEGKSANDQQDLNWANSYKFGFGQTRLGSQGIRKTDDRIDLESVLTYKMGTYVNPYAAASFKSQFARGYKYDSGGGQTAVSEFFDPAYLTQSVGVGYQPIPEVKTRLGAALREIVTSTFTAYADDPATNTIEKTRVDGGLESVTEVEWKLAGNILLTSKLEMFSPFRTPGEIVVRSDNTIAAKVNQYISVNLNVQLINEKIISPRTQIKQALAIGLSYVLL